MLTKKEVEAKGKELLEMMEGDGWELIVSENLGWHYSVSNKYISIFPCLYDNKERYTCLMSALPDRHWGEAFWTTQEVFDDPNDAVKHQIKVAREFVNKCLDAVQHVENFIGDHFTPNQYDIEID